MQITIEIPQKRYAFFKALMRSLSFPKIVSISPEASEIPYTVAEFEAAILPSLREMKDMQAGKKPLLHAKEELLRIENELVKEGYE